VERIGVFRIPSPSYRNKIGYGQKDWVETAFFGFETAFLAHFLKRLARKLTAVRACKAGGAASLSLVVLS
jgi:hypothetical protein